MDSNLVTSILSQALVLKKEAAAAEETTKVGILRGGNSGAIALGGKVLGKCPRLSLLRFEGIPVNEAETGRQYMFDAGHSNEDNWYDLLSLAYPKEQILREEEIPIKWEIDGVNVTGRPDMVLLDAAKNPVVGLELKLVSSLWTARDVMFAGEPKTDHLIQAAHYSWKLGVPFELWYASRVDWAVMCQNPKGNRKFDWVAKMFPRPGENLSEVIEYTYWKPDSANDFGWSKSKDGSERGSIGIPKKILPFKVGYRLEWNSAGQLSYSRIDGDGTVVPTVITQKGIEDYYRSIVYSKKIGILPPRPSQLKADGSKMGYSPCSYCELEGICESGVQAVDEFKSKVLEQKSR